MESNLVRELVPRKRRAPTKIIIEILEAASGPGVTKTSLVYKSNLNFARIAKYIGLLTDKDLLDCLESGSLRVYRITEKGKEALGILTNAEEINSGVQRNIRPLAS